MSFLFDLPLIPTGLALIAPRRAAATELTLSLNGTTT